MHHASATFPPALWVALQRFANDNKVAKACVVREAVKRDAGAQWLPFAGEGQGE